MTIKSCPHIPDGWCLDCLRTYLVPPYTPPHDTPRQLTEGECRNLFLDEVWSIVQSWQAESRQSYPQRIEGAAFSILAMLDGESADLPSFIVAPDPHPLDKESRQKKGRNWWPENYHLEVDSPLEDLHHEFKRRRPK